MRKKKQRRSFNRITLISDGEGREWFEDKDIQRVIISYFNNLYDSECRNDTDTILQSAKPKITPEMNEDLTKSMTE